MRIDLAALLFACVLAPVTVTAQAARAADVASIDGIIRAYYEVVSGPTGKSPTWNGTGARTIRAPCRDRQHESRGATRRQVLDLKGYHGDNRPRAEGFWEWETDRTVSRSGNMVHVWSSYASARTEGGEPFTRGVNSITLFHDGERWWIMGWMFDSAVR
ncbi:MAG: hypothetical protein IPF98_10400 [Gemmatimonadetes bacterium]|nr:hypothetical protein [Gemmatimonadota bacterium]